MPTLPADVTELPEADLMILFTELTEWACYAATQLADAASRERSAEQDLAAAQAAASVRASTERTVAAQKARAAADPAVQDEGDALLTISAYRRALDAVTGNAERRAQLVSRELSRRIARSDRSARASRWGGA
ncbi:hypothetical protein BGM09_01295 [Streptomyces sp. CBMA29]|nr:hypothetical protein [Streptomyces sp. CBMA29]